MFGHVESLGKTDNQGFIVLVRVETSIIGNLKVEELVIGSSKANSNNILLSLVIHIYTNLYGIDIV